MTPTIEQQAALATVLGLLEVDVSDMDYDTMTGELACIADDSTPKPARAEEVTRNCHAIARSYMRHLRRVHNITPDQRALTARVILALHECACEHDGADDWFDRAAEFARARVLLALRGRTP